MTPAERITRHFGGDWKGTFGLFPAPGHSATDRGMSVKDAERGDVLIHSFNGADPLAVKAECRRLGLLVDQDRARETWSVTGVYEFADESGAVLYRTRRHEHPNKPKRYTAERPDGQGGWLNGLGDVRRVLYRLPEVLAADPAAPVYLVEGERKADKLAAWGFPATAIAFGCKGWRKCYADALTGRTVAVLPDNDEPGRSFAEMARAAIEAAGGRAHLIALPGLPPKGDVIDWRGTADELRALTDAAVNPSAKLLPLADLALWSRTAPSATTFAVDRLVPAKEITIWTGDGGTNKSTGALQLCACAAACKPFLGHDVAPAVALYVTAEDADPRNHWVLAKICSAIGTTMAELQGRLHVSSLRGCPNNELATFDASGRLHATDSFTALRATIEHTRAKLVALDNVAHFYAAGNENDRGQVTGFINLLYQLCGDLDVTLLMIAHRNKAGDSFSGTTAWVNAVRSQIVSERPDDLDPDARLLKLGKANYARPGEALAHRWHDFALWRDDDLPSNTRAEIEQTVRATADNELFLRCMRIRNEQQRPVSESPASRTYAPRVFAEMAESKKIGVARLEAAMERLFRIGRVERGFVGRIDRKDKEGLREKCAEVRADPALTGCADVRRQDAPSALSHTLDTTYQPGAAIEAAAPDEDCPF